MKKISCGFLIALLALTGASQSMVGMQSSNQVPVIQLNDGTFMRSYRLENGSRADIYNDAACTQPLRQVYFDSNGQRIASTPVVTQAQPAQPVISDAAVTGAVAATGAAGLVGMVYVPTIRNVIAVAGLGAAAAYAAYKGIPALVAKLTQAEQPAPKLDPIAGITEFAGQYQQVVETQKEMTQTATELAKAMGNIAQSDKKKSKKAKEAYDSDSDSDSDSEERRPDYYADLERFIRQDSTYGSWPYYYNPKYKYGRYPSNAPQYAGYYIYLHHTGARPVNIRPEDYFANWDKKALRKLTSANRIEIYTPGAQRQQQIGYPFVQQPAQQPAAGRGRGRTSQPVVQQPVQFNFPGQQ